MFSRANIADSFCVPGLPDCEVFHTCNDSDLLQAAKMLRQEIQVHCISQKLCLPRNKPSNLNVYTSLGDAADLLSQCRASCAALSDCVRHESFALRRLPGFSEESLSLLWVQVHKHIASVLRFPLRFYIERHLGLCGCGYLKQSLLRD